MGFHFKQFAVTDTHCAMKVNTDGVLLGAWTPATLGSCRILDVGAGCGVVALIMAQRCPDACITAVEIDAEAAADCSLNLAVSPWADRLNCVCADFADFAHNNRFDIIVSNPPFFTETLKAPDKRRAIARHGEGLSPLSLLKLSANILSNSGVLAMITDTRNEAQIRLQAAISRLNPTRITYVHTRAGKPPRRILWLFSRDNTPCAISHLFLRDDNGQWHSDYQAIVNPLYLRMPNP